jgi:hypothetical protein
MILSTIDLGVAEIPKIVRGQTKKEQM